MKTTRSHKKRKLESETAVLLFIARCNIDNHLLQRSILTAQPYVKVERGVLTFLVDFDTLAN